MDLGALAEQIVSMWATRAGFVVNASQRDRYGWDQIFEIDMPGHAGPHDPLGLPTIAFSCRVQVKGTTGTARAAAMKLTNWKRAIQDPLPWFVLVLRFSRVTNALVGAALIHIGKEQVERAVERILYLKGEALDRLHKKKLRLVWNATASLTEPYEQSLVQAMAHAVGGSLHEYAVKKKQWYENAGLPDSPIAKVHFTVGSSTVDELYDSLMRAALSLDDGLAVSNLQMVRERFGVEQPMRDPSSPTTGTLQVGLSDREIGWDLVLFDKHGSRAVVAPVSFRFSASVFPMLPEKYWRVRVQRLLIDLQLKFADNSCAMTISYPDLQTPVNLRELKESAQVLLHLHEHRNEDIRFALEQQGATPFSATLRAPATLTRAAHHVLMGAQTVWQLLGQLGVVDDKLTLSLEEIQHLTPVAQAMLSARTGTSGPFHAETTVPKLAFKGTGRAAFLLGLQLEVAGYVHVELVALAGIPEIVADRGDSLVISLVAGSLRSMGHRRYRPSELKAFDFSNAAAEAANTLEQEGFVDVVMVPWEGISELHG